MSISRLASQISESPTLKLNEEARLLKVKGEPVIHLGAGEPKNKTPITAVMGAAVKLNTGDIKYVPTDGLPSLKNAIIHYTEENYRKTATPKNIIVTNGAKQSLYNILFSILNPKDEVIIIAPYWVSYPEMIKMAHGVPVVVSPEDTSFIPSITEIETAVTSKTKAIIINTPNNPSGVVYPENIVSDLVDYCERKNIFLISDDIYHKLVFDGVVSAPLYQFTQKDVENTKVVVVNGVAKTYGMTGFRIGWTIANKQLIQIMANVQSQITSCPAVVSQAAAEGALSGSQSIVENLRLMIQNQRDVLMQGLDTFTNVSTVRPSGTFYAFPNFSKYNKNSAELSKFLLDKALVVTVPGGEFGMEGHLRISYSGPMKDIIEGVKRMKWALDPNAPNEIFIGDRKLIRDWL